MSITVSGSMRVLLAFSGGIDSCAAVQILRDKGYEVEALTIDMIGDVRMLDGARECAERLSIPLHIVDGRQIFQREIIDNFTSEYLSGRTPAPCTRCNTLIKWELLAQKADELGIYHIATGHYFRLEEERGKIFVTRAADPIKDQSYYLWGVRQELLARALTPMGEQIKEEVKRESVIKKESMGVCFLQGAHYTDYICAHCGEMAKGEVIDKKGEVVGEHNGVARYTIGQKRGEGIPAGVRVTEIIAAKNQIRVDDNKTLFTHKLHLNNCHIIDDNPEQLSVMIRGLGLNPQGRATITRTDSGATIELLDDTAWAAAPGQPIVLYSKDRVIGGGYLTYAE